MLRSGQTPPFRDHSTVRAIASGWLIALPIDGHANIGPDCFDLVHLQDAVPRWHVVLAADDRLNKAVMLIGTQAPEIERRPARKGLQLLAMAAGAAVVIERVAFLDQGLGDGGRCYSCNHQ